MGKEGLQGQKHQAESQAAEAGRTEDENRSGKETECGAGESDGAYGKEDHRAFPHQQKLWREKAAPGFQLYFSEKSADRLYRT